MMNIGMNMPFCSTVPGATSKAGAIGPEPAIRKTTLARLNTIIHNSSVRTEPARFK